MTTFKAIFSRKWIIPTIVMILGMILLVRLGFWQLDRLQQKRAYNTLLAERWRQEPYDLNASALPADLTPLEYRRVGAMGKFDYANQILITNQTYNDTAGAIVVTPYVLDGKRAVLVARGWIPYSSMAADQWPSFQEPEGEKVIGLVRKSQRLPNGSAPTPPPGPQQEWYWIDVPSIQRQMPYQLEAAYIEQLPEENRLPDKLPIREDPVALDEGNHLSYAIQWFTFAIVLGFGYIMLVRYRTRKAAGLFQPVTPAETAAVDQAPVVQAPAAAVSSADSAAPVLTEPAPVGAVEQPRIA